MFVGHLKCGMRQARRGSIVMLAGLAAACAAPDAPTPAAQPATMDGAALRALYGTPHREEGVVLSGSHVGAPWTRWVRSNGAADLTAGHGLFADTGHYAVRDDTVCWTWGHIDKGRENCMRLARIGPDTYVSYDPDGSQGSRFSVFAQ